LPGQAKHHLTAYRGMRSAAEYRELIVAYRMASGQTKEIPTSSTRRERQTDRQFCTRRCMAIRATPSTVQPWYKIVDSVVLDAATTLAISLSLTGWPLR